jgi:hypothetical protein
MNRCVYGFSLIEVLIALGITLTVGLAVFQLFHRNEHVLHDQNLIIEMQQNVRAATSQAADEIRLAGQGVPIYAATFDHAASEPVAAIMKSSSGSRIDFRAGLSNVEGVITSPVPIDCAVGTPKVLSVADASMFSTSLGTTVPVGKFVYLWGPAEDSAWTWVRAELNHISATGLTVTPRQAGEAGSRFIKSPTVSLEEAVSFQLGGTSIRRATATDMTDPESPVWSAASEIGRNVLSMRFIYYDRKDQIVTPDSLVARKSIARVDLEVVVQPSEPLSTGNKVTYPISLRTIPRNLRIR